jgi:hypothetical protein
MGLGGLLGLGQVDSAYANGQIPRGVWIAYSVIGAVGGIASAYHGYKRNEASDAAVGWAIAWWFLGSWFPLITVPVALAQGYGQRARGTSGLGRRKRRR